MNATEHFAIRTVAEEIDAYDALSATLCDVVPMDAAIQRLVTDYYIKHKLVKLDRLNRRYVVKHGKLLDAYSVCACIIIVTPIA